MSEREKQCFIRGCETTNAEGKIMVFVPRETNRRKKWFAVARQTFNMKKAWCCEDHFELERDAENWQWFRHIGKNLKLKPDVVPHVNLFTPRKRNPPSQLSDSAKKRKEDTSILARQEHFVVEEEFHYNEPDSQQCEPAKEIENESQGVDDTSNSSHMSFQDPTIPTEPMITSSDCSQHAKKKRKQKLTYLQDPDEQELALVRTTEMALHVNTEDNVPNRFEVDLEPLALPLDDEQSHHRRTSSISPIRQSHHRRTSSISPIRQIHHRTTSSISPIRQFTMGSRESSSSPSLSSASTSSFYPTSSSKTDEDEVKIGQQMNVPGHLHMLKLYSRFFLGIPKTELCVIDLLLKHLQISERDILLTLKKLRTNDVNFRLGTDFGLSEHQAGMIFRRALPLIAKPLAQFVYWPSTEEIMLHMPLQFRYRFKKVQSIIDCFEVEIEKPSSAKAQALSWSAYKNCNTVKILISCTPNGFINFISKAYGGRISDNKLVQESEFINAIPCGTDVLADRGFKQLEPVLATKNCRLLRPASVSADKKMSKEEVQNSRRIACVRIHVERVISRIREFRFLNIHARIDNHYLNLVDHALLIVAAIVNIQGPLINK